MHQCHIVHGKGCLHLGHLVQLVEHHAGIGVLAQLDDDAYLVGTLVLDVGDAVEFLLGHQFGDALYQVGFDDAVGYLGDDDSLVVVFLVKLGSSTEYDATATGLVGFAHTAVAIYGATGGEVGRGYYLDEFIGGDVGVLQHGNRGVERLGEVVGRHIGCHTHGDTRGTVDQQVGEAGREHGGLDACVVVVRLEIYCVGFQVAQHLLAHASKAHLGVTHGGGSVAID